MFQVDHLECDVFSIQILKTRCRNNLFKPVHHLDQVVHPDRSCVVPQCLPALHAVLIFGPFEQCLEIP